MRVHELAKELELTSKELLSKLKTLKIAAKSHTSVLDEASVTKVRSKLKSSAKSTAKKSKTAKPSKPTSVKKKAVKTKAPARSKTTTAVRKPTATKVKSDVKAKAVSTVKKSPAPVPTVKKVSVVKVKKVEPKVTVTPHAIAKEPEVPKVQEVPVKAPVVSPPKQIKVSLPITVKDLALHMDIKPNDLIKHLMKQRVFASIVQPLDEEVSRNAAKAFNFEILAEPTVEDEFAKACEPDPKRFVSRAPIVTFMGHVDHGKTSLLDAIREATVAEKESGGITQHIGAYEATLEKGHVTFLDTPGHEAFTALRARGANATDVVVLVVAADDGVMPQTVEAIDHAKAADVPIVVAINKIDIPGANSNRVMQQLTEYGLVGEEWGGKTIIVPVSAKTREGIDKLLDMLLLEAEMLELKADPQSNAQGIVIEAKKTKDRGSVATLLVQHGTLKVGETLIVGDTVGRVRAMINDRNHRVKEARPAQPIEILGLDQVPRAGDKFYVVTDEKAARKLAERRRDKKGSNVLIHPKRITLDDLHEKIAAGKLKELRLILKADVQGSIEAILHSLQKLDAEEHDVQIKILHSGTGDINESDVVLAAASDAIIIGFHIGIYPTVQVLAANERVDVHIYAVIYELVDSLKSSIEGLMEPIVEENFLGRAEVRKIFQVSKVGMVAGCKVTKGTIRRDGIARVIRGKDRIFAGKISNLKKVKDDVREIQEGQECGISVDGSVDYQVGDLIESWEIKKTARKLS